jgi:mono/diheme cytochrome c family protein
MRGICLSLLMAATLSAFAGSAPTYVVQCQSDAKTADQCLVDKQTYIGWRTYHSSCNHCHGQDGRGGSFAPNLVSGNAAVDDYASFVRVTLEGTRSQTSVMPGFKDNPNINDRIDALYAYLKARSDGRLPSGRPAK